jgi:NADPH-dependent 2,4-dienoyl-CoA reductase/sulfur reductase-like enzyme
VAVVGGGLIGSEIASAVAASGLRVTIVDRSPLPLARTVGDAVAAHLLARHEARGVRVLPRTNVVAARTEGGRVRGLQLDSGELLQADLVIVAAGTVPNVDWLGSSGLDIHNGVRCTPTLFASGSLSIVAAGDVARTSYPLLDSETARVEHWRNAMEQGRRAAANLLLGPQDAVPFEGTPRYSTTIQGQAIRVVGFPQLGDESAIVWGATVDSFVVAVGRRRRLVGMLVVNAGDREIAWYTGLVEASARGFVDIRDLLVRGT